MELAPTVKRRLDQLSSIGSNPTGGLTRLLYSDEWLTAQKYVQEEMTAMGMTTKFDGVGNLFGRIEGKDLPNETVMTGSHIDTVVNGGNLDGQFGVLASLTAVEYLKEKYGQPQRSLEVISMAEEEGSRFPTVFWGSKNFVGIADNEEVKDIKDGQGKGFVDEMRRQGFDFQEQTRRDDIVAFVEEHIEQGSILETEGDQIGVVTSIAGQRRYNITLKGQANHAGTTPMSYRHDVVYGMAKIVTLALERAHEIGDPLVMTFGKVVPKPNTVNVVPGEVLFTMDCRHTDPDFLIEFSTQIEEMMKEVAQDMGLGIEIDRWMDEAPVPMSEKVYQTIENCAKSGGYKYWVMHGGAGHDSQIIAPVYPTAMIFVPSIGGISHNPAEETNFEDLVNGVQLLDPVRISIQIKRSDNHGLQ